MSSPADQFVADPVHRRREPRPRSPKLAARQNSRDAAPSDIEQQARADVDSLEATVEGVEQAPADQQGLLTQPKNIAAYAQQQSSPPRAASSSTQGVSQKTAKACQPAAGQLRRNRAFTATTASRP
ncbi:MAG: hypothetical protein KL863_15520 [Rhizobium sp.]|nr:hypothetical protein [Rhizobium sp.]